MSERDDVGAVSEPAGSDAESEPAGDWVAPAGPAQGVYATTQGGYTTVEGGYPTVQGGYPSTGMFQRAAQVPPSPTAMIRERNDHDAATVLAVVIALTGQHSADEATIDGPPSVWADPGHRLGGLHPSPVAWWASAMPR